MSLKTIEANALGHFKYLPEKGDYPVAVVQDLTCIRCGLGSSMFNIAYGGLTSSATAPIMATIQSVIDHYGNEPFAWWVPQSQKSSQFTEALTERGFTIEADEHAMLTRLDAMPQRFPNSTLEVRRVQCQGELDDFISVVEVYDPTVRSFYQNLPQAALNGEEQLYVGYTEGRAVSTAILFVNGESAGIFGVITDERERGKGFGTDIMLHLLEAARAQSLKTVTLSASSDSGFRIYERLGFERLGQFECFEWPGG